VATRVVHALSGPSPPLPRWWSRSRPLQRAPARPIGKGSLDPTRVLSGADRLLNAHAPRTSPSPRTPVMADRETPCRRTAPGEGSPRGPWTHGSTTTPPGSPGEAHVRHRMAPPRRGSSRTPGGLLSNRPRLSIAPGPGQEGPRVSRTDGEVRGRRCLQQPLPCSRNPCMCRLGTSVPTGDRSG
jgi:hypothetical protein